MTKTLTIKNIKLNFQIERVKKPVNLEKELRYQKLQKERDTFIEKMYYII